MRFCFDPLSRAFQIDGFRLKRSVSSQIKSNPLFRHVTPRSTKVHVKTCTCLCISANERRKRIKMYAFLNEDALGWMGHNKKF